MLLVATFRIEICLTRFHIAELHFPSVSFFLRHIYVEWHWLVHKRILVHLLLFVYPSICHTVVKD